jgi:hypothetical protein
VAECQVVVFIEFPVSQVFTSLPDDIDLSRARVWARRPP